MESMPQVVVRGLTHMYAQGHQSLVALTNVDLDVRPGEFVSIIGPSGGGKTTLLKIIGGLLEPTQGSVLVDGFRPEESRRRKTIGFVFQDPSLLPWRTVQRNVHLPLELNRDVGSEVKERPERLVEAVGLSEFANYYPYQLSGGMRQRVALARTLALDPKLLLMDEPFGSLDEMTREAMRYEILRLWEGSSKTVVQVTHSIPEALLLSDRVVVLSSRPGRILAQLPIDLPRPRSEATEQSHRFLKLTREIKQALSKGTAFGTNALKTDSQS